ncbi:MAG TPA: methylmalonyl Co-A mutase-associated GTPase MeaB [Candidatus Aminicenantes bacterium]|nr:methylmalonyl Co-A mutase-associated GTPase MeaB [Candidatus Aminicenantes bacterium]
MRDLIKEIRRGNARAIAKAISLVENDSAAAQRLMRQVFAWRKDAVVLGITGAPGTGKSTLVDQLIGRLRAAGRKIGIVAVDPSSPFSGGAILGDRIRMMRHSVDADVFIRSMATRGHLGGLAKATGEAIAILEAAGKDYILVETVGVGQDEVEVVKLADVVLVVLTPDAGDEIQAFKAGIMEIADIFVINKADHPGADKMERQLRAMLDLGLPDKDKPSVIKTVATKGQGTDGMLSEVDRLMEKRDRRLQEIRRKRLLAWMLRDVIREKIDQLISRDIPDSVFEEYVDQIYHRRTDPYTVADRLISRLKEKG